MVPLVLLALFLVELAAWAAYGDLGWSLSPRWLWVWVLPLVVVTAWGLLASPRARYDDARIRLVTKVVVLAGAVAALWAAGRPWLAVALGLCTVLVHAAAAHPAVRRAYVASTGG